MYIGSQIHQHQTSGHRRTSRSDRKDAHQRLRTARVDRYRLAEMEDETHPNRSLACAIVAAACCPILGTFSLEHQSDAMQSSAALIEFLFHSGMIAIYYAIRAVRAQSQGFYAEATTFYKQAIRWSLITFIVGLILGSVLAFGFFVKTVLFF